MRKLVTVALVTLAACGQGTTSQTNSGAPGADAPKKNMFTEADLKRCRAEVPGLSITAIRGMIRLEEDGSVTNYDDDTVERIARDGNSAFGVAPAADGTCTRAIAVVDTVIDGNQIKFRKQCHVKSFQDTPSGKSADWVDHCESWDGDQFNA